MVEKYVVKVGKRGSEAHFYPIKHSCERALIKREVHGHEKLLKDLDKFHALAVEGLLTPKSRKVARKTLREKIEGTFMVSGYPLELLEKCEKNGLSLVFIDAQADLQPIKITAREQQIREYQMFIGGKTEEKMLEEAAEKLPAKWKKLLKNADSFRSLVMASNLERAISLHEKHYKGKVKIAVMAHREHIDEMKELLQDPDYQKIKKTVRTATKGTHGIARWKGLVLLKPRGEEKWR